MPRARPTIRQWMEEYNRLARIAQGRGIRVRTYANLRVANEIAQRRVEELARRINEPIRLGAVPLRSEPTVQAWEAAPGQVTTVQGGVSGTEHHQRDEVRRLRDLVQGVREVPIPAPQAPAAPVWTGPRGRRSRSSPVNVGPRGQAYTPPPATPFVAMDPTEFTFGAEFEFLIPNTLNQQRIAAAISAVGVPCHGELYNHFTRQHWKIITDGSITVRPGYVGFEAVSPVLQGLEGFRQMEKICEVLVSLGATVNKSCGFHVHIGITQNMNRPEFFKRLVGHYCANERHIDAIMAPSRRGSSNTYCQPINSVVKDRIDRAETVPQIIAQVPSRFSKVNLQSFWRHRTVEFRHHQGTVEKMKAIAWVKFCMHLVALATKPEPVQVSSNLLDFLGSIQIPADEVGYFASRWAHFNLGHDAHT